jgi:trans-aconitate methyltransferase
MSLSSSAYEREEQPNASRVYDYLLGGSHNFEADRQAAEQLCALYPDAPLSARVNRYFLRRVVNYLHQQGIDQFLDGGSGLPTLGSVHEVLHRHNPNARVVYVDSDPVAVKLSHMVIENDQAGDRVAAIQADVAQPKTLLDHPDVLRLIDFNRPVAALFFAVFQFIVDDDALARMLQSFYDVLAPGSYIALSHPTVDGVSNKEAVESLQNLYVRTVRPVTLRNRLQIAGIFEGYDLVDPGMVFIPLWRPAESSDPWLDQPERSLCLGGVGRKPS